MLTPQTWPGRRSSFSFLFFFTDIAPVVKHKLLTLGEIISAGVPSNTLPDTTPPRLPRQRSPLSTTLTSKSLIGSVVNHSRLHVLTAIITATIGVNTIHNLLHNRSNLRASVVSCLLALAAGNMTTGSSHVTELLLGCFSKARTFFVFTEAVFDILRLDSLAFTLVAITTTFAIGIMNILLRRQSTKHGEAERSQPWP